MLGDGITEDKPCPHRNKKEEGATPNSNLPLPGNAVDFITKLQSQSQRFGQEKRGTKEQSPAKETGDSSISRAHKRLFTPTNSTKSVEAPVAPPPRLVTQHHAYAKKLQETPEPEPAQQNLLPDHNYIEYDGPDEDVILPSNKSDDILQRHGLGHEQPYTELLEEVEIQCKNLCKTSQKSVLRNLKVKDLVENDVPNDILAEMEER